MFAHKISLGKNDQNCISDKLSVNEYLHFKLFLRADNYILIHRV